MKEKRRELKVKMLKSVVGRNKLKNSGYNINKMIKYLEDRGIEAKSFYHKEV